ncbi:hypothetical protein [Streptomyces bohaiensis]|uniref:hypothetical protein n=1 Tax=Streptomyces bohaiensis TaxID=1431344 RepID=UPI003B77268D
MARQLSATRDRGAPGLAARPRVGRPGDGPAPAGGRTAGWFVFADGRDPDPPALLPVGDAMPPAAFGLGVTGWTPTVELATHVRARPAAGPLCVVAVTRNPASGFLEEAAEVWDSAGRLVAQARRPARMPRAAAG